MLEPCDGKLSCTVLGGKGVERPLTYPILINCNDWIDLAETAPLFRHNSVPEDAAGE